MGKASKARLKKNNAMAERNLSRIDNIQIPLEPVFEDFEKMSTETASKEIPIPQNPSKGNIPIIEGRDRCTIDKQKQMNMYSKTNKRATSYQTVSKFVPLERNVKEVAYQPRISFDSNQSLQPSAVEETNLPNPNKGGFRNQSDGHQNQIATFQNQTTHFNQPQPGYSGFVDNGIPKISYPKGIPKSMVHAQRQEMQAQTRETSQPSPVEQCEPVWILNNVEDQDDRGAAVDKPVFVETSVHVANNEKYSPTDVYEESHMDVNDEVNPKKDSPQVGQKRISAFQRLGPQTQPKTPKITINLNLQNEQPIRKVVDETDVHDDEKYSPVHLRPDVINSTDETVMKYLVHWPWKKEVSIKRTICYRTSKTAMLLDMETMEDLYERGNAYFMVGVRGYPLSWNKEDVLDAVIDSVKGKSLIPCLIDFARRTCRFLVLKNKQALLEIHKNAFVYPKDDVELLFSISQICLSVNHTDFIPRLVLGKRVMMGYDGESKLNLSGFTLKPDISHFIYFPLNKIVNQIEITELKTTIAWNYLRELDLSHNRLTSIAGFNLPAVAPNLKSLNLSHNKLDRITALLKCRNLPLKSIFLEGNPLCSDYIDTEHYIKVIRMMFPTVAVIDGENIHLPGTMPTFKRHFGFSDARAVVDTFLEIFFPLIDADEDQRDNIQGLYDRKATMTVTYNHVLRCRPVFRSFRKLFMRARNIEEQIFDSLEGASDIAKLILNWPATEHDPYTFSVDVMYHNDTATIFRVSGILKLTAKSLADDEYMLAFTRTVVLKTENGTEYKICNEMIYWDEPTKECVKQAFQITKLSSLQLSLKLDTEPDEDLKKKLVELFMKITKLDQQASSRCLEKKNWHFQDALEYYANQVKLDNTDAI